MSGLLPVKDMLDGDWPSYENIEEAEPLCIVETTEGWAPLVEHLAGKHDQKSHGRHSTAIDKVRDEAQNVDMEQRMVNLTDLVARDKDMRSVLDSGRVSDTPDVPVWLRVRSDGPGLEIADGYHRVAQALRDGRSAILADIDPVPDDEPLVGPFFDFKEWMSNRSPA